MNESTMGFGIVLIALALVAIVVAATFGPMVADAFTFKLG